MTPDQERQIAILIEGQAQLVDRMGRLADAIEILAATLVPQDVEQEDVPSGNPHAGLDG